MIVLVDSGCDRKNVWIENNVFGRKPHLVHQQIVGACTNFLTTLERVGLTFFVKSHHHRCGPITTAQLRLFEERLLPLFEGNRIDDRLALYAFKSRLDYRPLGTINHDRHTRDIGL